MNAWHQPPSSNLPNAPSLLTRRDVVSEEIQRLGKTYPSIVSALITERDQYMVARLRECATILRPRCIVAVVGAGHVNGMAKIWNANIDAAQLGALSQVRSSAVAFVLHCARSVHSGRCPTSRGSLQRPICSALASTLSLRGAAPACATSTCETMSL